MHSRAITCLKYVGKDFPKFSLKNFTTIMHGNYTCNQKWSVAMDTVAKISKQSIWYNINDKLKMIEPEMVIRNKKWEVWFANMKIIEKWFGLQEH